VSGTALASGLIRRLKFLYQSKGRKAMLLSYVAGTISVFIWALLPIIIKSSFQEIPVSFFLILRFSFATVFMGILMWKLWREILKFSWSQHLQFIFILGANYSLQSLAIKDLPVSWYIIIFALNPLLTLLLMKIKWNHHLILSIFLGLSGVSFFIFKDLQNLNSLPLKSFLYLFGGMLTWVLYTLKAKSAQKIISDSGLTLYTQFISFIACLIVWLLDSTPTISLSNLSLISLGSILLSGIGVPLAYYLYLYSLRRTPVFCQMSQYLELFFGLIFSWVLYQENFHEFKILGTGLIVISLFFSSQIPHSEQISS
jgi:drug/metabolite transporter (DMT)-like permease